METHDLLPIPADVWLAWIEAEYLRAYIPAGGAAVKIAVDMVREGLIDRKEAVARIVPSSLDQLLHPTLDPKAPRKVIARGMSQ